MHKILLTALATVFLVLFGMENSDHVPVSFVVGSPTKIRLFFLLLIAAAFGFFFSYIRGLGRELRLKKEIRRLTQARRSADARMLPGRLEEGIND